MNTLFRKGYFLVGVMIAADMFILNEVKAMEDNNTVKNELNGNQKPASDLMPQYTIYDLIKSENNDIDNQRPCEKIKRSAKTLCMINAKTGKQFFLGKKEEKFGVQSFFGFLLYWENTINFFGGALFTLANSFYKFYENKPGFYFDYYFAGWNSNPFAKGYLQFCPNINLGRGILWLIPGTYIFIKGINISEKEDDAEDHFKSLYVSYLAAERFENDTACATTLIGVFLLQGFVSMPLTLHFSKFSISISLDSIIWGIVGMILELKDKKEKEEEEEEKNERTRQAIDFYLKDYNNLANKEEH